MSAASSGGSNSGNSGPSYSGMSSIGSGGTKNKSKFKTTTTTNNREDNRTTQYTRYSSKQVASGKAKVAADIAKDNKTNFDNMKYEGSKAPSILGKTLDFIGVSEKSFDTNKAYYEKNVIGKNNFTASPDDFKRYMSSRGTGKIDAMGRSISNESNNGGNTQPGITKNIGGRIIQTTAPTEAELSQSAAADAAEYDLRKTKKKGRSMTRLTSSKGVTDDKLTLGKPSLLGA